MIEPVNAHCFESDPCDVLTRVYGRHPVWTRLELAEGAQDNFRIRRDRAGSEYNFPERDVLELGNNTRFGCFIRLQMVAQQLPS